MSIIISMTQIAMFGIALIYGMVIGLVIITVSLSYSKIKTRYTIIIIDFVLCGIGLAIAGVLMQIFNHRVSFYLYCGVVIGYLSILFVSDWVLDMIRTARKSKIASEKNAGRDEGNN